MGEKEKEKFGLKVKQASETRQGKTTKQINKIQEKTREDKERRGKSRQLKTS